MKYHQIIIDLKHKLCKRLDSLEVVYFLGFGSLEATNKNKFYFIITL